jgi:cobyrinic acid a,c-diamide synthase
MRRCQALCISAPASNQGKTMVTAGLAQLFRRRGRNVRVFKTGPDFLDPMVLERASGNPVYQLDLWMNGEQDCRRLLCQAAADADLILIEGVMGLYDGKPSTADLAELFHVPVLAVIDAGSMAQTFAAIASGLAAFRPGLTFAGVIANNVASFRHAQMLEEAAPMTIACLGKIFRQAKMALPSRHLGLVQAAEIDDIEVRLNASADAVQSTEIERALKPVEFRAAESSQLEPLLTDTTIAVARDQAFSFLYEANLRLLESMGARLVFFSPLADTTLPSADCVYLPGGYPELFLDSLSDNLAMKSALRRHFEGNNPIYAECGGMLYLLDRLVDKEGYEGKMLGLLPGEAVMEPRLKALGYQSAEFDKGVLRGHTFHHSSVKITEAPITYGKRAHDSSQGEPVYRVGSMTASYLHFYFPSNPSAAASFFKPVPSGK